mgnify:CR=1 FL=1
MAKFKVGDRLILRDFTAIVWVVGDDSDTRYLLEREIPSGLDKKFDSKTRDQKYIEYAYEKLEN